MIIRSIFLIIALLLTSVSYASVPDYIEKNTLENICRYSECFPDLKVQYEKYYIQQFWKAFAVSYNIDKATKTKKINSFGMSYEWANSNEAKREALKACNKHNRNCQILFLNNSIIEKTYNNLTQNLASSVTKLPVNEYNCTQFLSEISINDYSDESVCTYAAKVYEHNCFIVEASKRGLNCGGSLTSSNTLSYFESSACKDGYKKVGDNCLKTYIKCSPGFEKEGDDCIKYTNKNIPTNAYKYGSGWKCKSGYYQNNDYCSKLPSNAISRNNSDGFYCKSGYKKSGKSCIKITIDSSENVSIGTTNPTIPLNAYKSGSSWKCKSGYYQNSGYCSKLPSNAISRNDSDGFYCKSGYKKSGSSCIKRTNNDENVNLGLIIGVVLFFFILLILVTRQTHGKKCAWCNGYKIKFVSGREGKWYWKYSNKDGSRDKRRKDNFEQAKYISEYNCQECAARTKFLHKESQHPSPSRNILKRQLLENGEGKRKGSDYGV